MKGGAEREVHVDLDRARIDALAPLAARDPRSSSRRRTSTSPPVTTTRARARSACAPSASSRTSSEIREPHRRDRGGRLERAPLRHRNGRGRLRGAPHAHPRRTARRPSRSTSLKQSGTNTIAVNDAVKAKLALIEKTFPAGMRADIDHRAGAFIRENTHEVEVSIVFGGAMAILVILFFMLDLRSMLISAVATGSK